MKKGSILVFLVSLVFLISACTYTPTFGEGPGSCCIVGDFSFKTIGCAAELTTDVECNDIYGSYGNTQFKNQACWAIPECQAVQDSCMGVTKVDGISHGYLVENNTYSCGYAGTSIKDKSYICTSGRLTLYQNCVAASTTCDQTSGRCIKCVGEFSEGYPYSLYEGQHICGPSDTSLADISYICDSSGQLNLYVDCMTDETSTGYCISPAGICDPILEICTDHPDGTECNLPHKETGSCCNGLCASLGSCSPAPSCEPAIIDITKAGLYHVPLTDGAFINYINFLGLSSVTIPEPRENPEGNGYLDNSHQIRVIPAGTTEAILTAQLRGPPYYDYRCLAIWIDWNKDGILETRICGKCLDVDDMNPVEVTISIPSSLSPGSYLMRIAEGRGDSDCLNAPCDQSPDMDIYPECGGANPYYWVWAGANARNGPPDNTRIFQGEYQDYTLCVV